MQQHHLDLKLIPPRLRQNAGFHKGYPCRKRWLIKSFNLVQNNPCFFERDDAFIRLGVLFGHVKPIKFWAIAFKLLELSQGRLFPTTWGQLLLDQEQGLDPFLCDPNSLYWLHYQLLKPPCYLPLWAWFFDQFNGIYFSKEELESRYLDEPATLQKTALNQELTCLIHSLTERPNASLEDDRTWQELRLLVKVEEENKKLFYLQLGSKANLSPQTIVATCLDFIDLMQLPSPVKLSTLAYSPGSPGRTFLLKIADVEDAMGCLDCDAFSVGLNSESHGIVEIHSPPGDAARIILSTQLGH